MKRSHELAATTTTAEPDDSDEPDNGDDLDNHDTMELDDGSVGEVAETGGEMELDEGAGAGLPDVHHYNAFDSTYEDTASDAQSSLHSWYDIPTPPPSPPPSPFQLSDEDNISEDKDGYHNITTEDYCEYDHWYSEDSQAELDEMVTETLTEEELDSIKMAAIHQFGHISQCNYERIRFSFWEKVWLLTLQRLGTHLKTLSGITPLDINCCINICYAFTGNHTEEETCSKCGAARYDDQGCPQQTYQYIPTIPCFQALFNNPTMIEKLLYRHNYVEEDGAMDDLFDSDTYKNLCQQNILIDAQLHDLFPVVVIPGPFQPKDFNSYLVPYVNECLELARGVKTYNVLTRWTFILRQHPVMVCSDMQAIKHYEQMKGPNSMVPCCECLAVSIYHSGQRTYYIPLAKPLDPDNPSATTSSYDPLTLPLRTEEKTIAHLAWMEHTATQPCIKQLREEIAGYVERFEEYYYQYDYD
ncbi:hypothetical protein FRC06_001476 [Ceratobasidium sp. 370]|nr:hypothetical protein FRC06_001476 [Ceratobasidium sp. 370]